MSRFIPKMLPYDCIRNDNAFTFTTISGSEYEIYFTPGEDYLPGVIFAPFTRVFGFRQLKPAIRKSFDPRISATVIQVVLDYFTDKRNVMLYVCDQSDKRERYRDKLFRLWYKIFGSDYSIIKKDIQAEETLFITIVYHADNPFRTEIEASLPDLENKWT
ncbi:MAG: DUF6169 family protein [Hymenobacteraceae bacterium]|nr:DUF6169 family protein [Hymenobacteraceae bacterium]MDX5397291.1 DUF6169 family protein [Hymenobacteraceae bacterium]MDX5513369.1 DUF6169 family protein [Hymenobacteraceae bacterium]